MSWMGGCSPGVVLYRWHLSVHVWKPRQQEECQEQGGDGNPLLGQMALALAVLTATLLPVSPSAQQPRARRLLGWDNTVKIFPPAPAPENSFLGADSAPKEVRVFSCGNRRPGLSGNTQSSARFLALLGVERRTRASLWDNKDCLRTKCLPVVQTQGRFRTRSGNPTVLTQPRGDE